MPQGQDYPDGYPGPPPGADPDGRWTGGGQWRPYRWVANTPPPPDPVDTPPDDPVSPPPPRTPSYDFTGAETTRPAPGGFASWDQYNAWRNGLRSDTLGGVGRLGSPGPGPATKGPDQRGRDAGSVGRRDPSDVQDQLSRDRDRVFQAPPPDPAQRRGRPQPYPGSDFRPPPRLFDEIGRERPVLDERPQISDPYPIAQLMRLFQPQVRPANPLQVLFSRLGLGGF